MAQSINDAWSEYSSGFKPDLPPRLIAFVRRSFFSGAGLVLANFLDIDPVSDDPESTAKMMDDMEDEMREFVREFKRDQRARN